MTGRTSECNQPGTSAPQTRRAHYALLGTVCALVVGVYAWSAKSGRAELGSLNAEKTYYNLLVQGFRAGQLDLRREVPSELAPLLASHDPAAASPLWFMEHQLLDLSYYKGKLYLYFGVTPALVFFWPWAVLTGHYLLHQDAAVIFFSVGFLASVGLLWGVWRRYFMEVSFGAVSAGVMALGLATFIPAILKRCDVYEVAISCGCALTMVTLLLLWQALQARRGRAGWLAAASLAYGLALGARPSLLFGAVILLVPVARSWRGRAGVGQRPQLWALLLAATGPITVIGLGLLLYNFLRFGDPLEFGQRYQLPAGPRQQFSLDYLWFNFRVCFLEPARWSAQFPFVHEIAVPPLPQGSSGVYRTFGLLTNIPVVWLALAAPLVWRSRLAEARSTVRWFLAAVALQFGTCTVILCLHNSMYLRYEVEFACMLVLLAVIGIFGLERALAGCPGWRLVARCGWGLLLAFSVSFNLFLLFEQASESYVCCGVISFQKGQMDEAIDYYRKALELQSDNARAHGNLGATLLQQGKVTEAIGHLEQALHVKPDFVEAHHNLGIALSELGRVTEAIGHYEQALHVKPDFVEAHNVLAVALRRQGKVAESIGHLEQALQFNPAYAEAHNNLGVALFQQGQLAQSIGHLEQALRFNPDYLDAHYNLACAFSQQGQVPEAIGHLEQALRLKPEDVELQNKLAWLLATCADGAIRNGARAVELAEGANKLVGGKDAAVLGTLAAAYAEAGRFSDAIATAKQARELAIATGRKEMAEQAESRLKLYESGRPYHEE